MKKFFTVLSLAGSFALGALTYHTVDRMATSELQRQKDIRQTSMSTLNNAVSNHYVSISNFLVSPNISTASKAQRDNMVEFVYLYSHVPDLGTNGIEYIVKYIQQSTDFVEGINNFHQISLASEARYLRAYRANVVRRIDTLSTAIHHGWHSPQVRNKLLKYSERGLNK